MASMDRISQDQLKEYLYMNTDSEEFLEVSSISLTDKYLYRCSYCEFRVIGHHIIAIYENFLRRHYVFIIDPVNNEYFILNNTLNTNIDHTLTDLIPYSSMCYYHNCGNLFNLFKSTDEPIAIPVVNRGTCLYLIKNNEPDVRVAVVWGDKKCFLDFSANRIKDLVVDDNLLIIIGYQCAKIYRLSMISYVKRAIKN